MPVIGEQPSINLDRLLCATDFSRASEHATAFASAIAKRFSASLELVHIFDPSVCTSYEEAMLLPSLRERQQTRTECLDKACQAVTEAGVRSAALLRRGRTVWKEILAEARRYDPAMIVAGTQSKDAIDRFMIGSTAEQLIRNAECPVLTVGPHVKAPQDGALCFQSIVFATDFSAAAAKAEVLALAIAEDSGAHLSICYVQDQTKPEPDTKLPDTALRKRLERTVSETSKDWCTIECVVDHGAASEAILDLATAKHADLIVLGARRGTFWLTHVGQGVTLDVIREAVCPVLTVC